mmetsp:Transcript_49106/g.72000  ORF Transcript_49106/g.72000 Transcript_49106/m.72000 type:complete len:309 (+) Transcript_49106:185-1111(+)
MAVFPIVVSPLLPDAERSSADTSPQEFIDMYRDVLMVFGYLACGATVSTLLLLFADVREGGWLNASAAALQERDITRARRSNAFSSVPALYTHHVHSRNKYLSRLGIRPLGGPRLRNETLDRTSGCLPSTAVGVGEGYDTDGSVRTSDLSNHSSYHSSYRNFQHFRHCDDGYSLGDEAGMTQMTDGQGEYEHDSSWAEEWRGSKWGGGDRTLSQSLVLQGLDGVANRGESLLDWALKETSADAQVSAKSATCGTSDDLSGTRHMDTHALEGAGIPPLLGRVRRDSALSSNGSCLSITETDTSGPTSRE